MNIALIGDGGHAKEVMVQMEEELIRFVSDEFYKEKDGVLPLSKFDPKKYRVLIAVGNSSDRKKILKKLPKETLFFSFIHPTAQLLGKNINIGVGSFIGVNSILTEDINLGNHALLNRGNQIGHDCNIGDFFSMMPGSILSGNCEIGNEVYLGTNSSVKEKTSICDKVIVGMCSCVINDVKVSGTYVGSPIKKIK